MMTPVEGVGQAEVVAFDEIEGLPVQNCPG